MKKVRVKRKPKAAAYFDGTKQASAALDIPVDVLSSAKRAGCPMFRGSRILKDGLREWIADNADKISPHTDIQSLKLQKLVEEVREKRLKNDTTAGLMIQRADVIAAHSPILTKFKESCYGKLVNEFPVYAAGQDTPTIRTMARKVADELVELLRGIGVEEWGDR